MSKTKSTTTGVQVSVDVDWVDAAREEVDKLGHIGAAAERCAMLIEELEQAAQYSALETLDCVKNHPLYRAALLEAIASLGQAVTERAWRIDRLLDREVRP